VDLFDLTGKVAVVTGGTRGIGLMIARGLLQAGASVYVSSRKPEAGEAAVAELSVLGRVVSVPADLSREEECARLAAEVGGVEERVHILVNNAGTNWGAPLAEFPASGWDKVLNLNLKAPFYVTRAFLPLLEAAGTADDPARVINVGSIDGLRVPEFYLFLLVEQGRPAPAHPGARPRARATARHGQRGGPWPVRVEDDGGDAGRVRGRDPGLLAARAHRPPGRYGGRGGLPERARGSVRDRGRHPGGWRDLGGTLTGRRW
jgi:NAD(P)-dependent dehydrogenase (short-subunit alcohol dehydrogenase family)